MFLWIIRGERGGRYMCLQKCSLWQIVDARDMRVFLCNAMLTPGWCTGWRVQDAAKRQKCKMARNGIDEDPWGSQAKAMGEIWILWSAEIFRYWCRNLKENIPSVLFDNNLWTITPALINSLGPSIAVSVYIKSTAAKRTRKHEDREWRIFMIQDARYNWPDIRHKDNEQA